MDTIEKIQVFEQVAKGKEHPSVLKELIPEPNEEGNWIRDAVEHIVAQRLQQAAANKQRIRFKIAEMVPGEKTEIIRTEVTNLDGSKKNVRVEVPKMVEKVEFTDWYPEHSQFSAPMMMGQLRQRFQKAAISVERE